MEKNLEETELLEDMNLGGYYGEYLSSYRG